MKFASEIESERCGLGANQGGWTQEEWNKQGGNDPLENMTTEEITQLIADLEETI
jgi:hypothetical protein